LPKQETHQYISNPDLINNNLQNDFKSNRNVAFTSSETENNFEKADLNYKNFIKRQSNLEKENNNPNNANNNNYNYFFNPQKQRSYNFFEQDLKQRNTHRKKLSNDALLNNISGGDYCNFHNNYNNNNENEINNNCNQTFTDYTFTNHNDVIFNTNRNMQLCNVDIDNKLCHDRNSNADVAYENFKCSRIYNDNNNIQCKNLKASSSDEFFLNNFVKSNKNNANFQAEYYKDNPSIFPLNTNNNNLFSLIGNNSTISAVSAYEQTNNKSNRNKYNKNMNCSHLLNINKQQPINFTNFNLATTNENPEKRNLINRRVAAVKKNNLEANKNFITNKNWFLNTNNTNNNNIPPYDSEIVNCEYVSENTNANSNTNNNIDSSANLQSNLRLAELNKFKNQEGGTMNYSFYSYRPSTLIFRKGNKGSKSMDITNRTDSYFLGEDISEEDNDISFNISKSNSKSLIYNTPSNPYINNCIIQPANNNTSIIENNRRNSNRSNRKISKNNNYNQSNTSKNLSDYKGRRSFFDYKVNNKLNDVLFNNLNNIIKENPEQNQLKKRSKSTRIINSNYSRKLNNKSNSFKQKNNNFPNLSNGIKTNTDKYQLERELEDDFYYNEDLDEFSSGIEVGSSVNNGNYICIEPSPKINSIRNFDTAENNIFNNTENNFYNTSSNNNEYFNNNFLNTNFHEETENNNNNYNYNLDKYKFNQNGNNSPQEDNFAYYEKNYKNQIDTDNKVKYNIHYNRNINSKQFNNSSKKQKIPNYSILKNLSGNKVKKTNKNLTGFYSDNKILKRNKSNPNLFDLERDNNYHCPKNISARKGRNSYKNSYLQPLTNNENTLYKKNNSRILYGNENGNNKDFGFSESKKIKGASCPIMDEKGVRLDYMSHYQSKRNVKFDASIKKPIRRRLTYNEI